MDEDAKKQYWNSPYPVPGSDSTVDAPSQHSSDKHYGTPGSFSVSRNLYDSYDSGKNFPATTMSYESDIYGSPSSQGTKVSLLYPGTGLLGTSMNQIFETSSEIRHTPSTLGWTHGTKLLELYRFQVPKGKEPYFELLEKWSPTYETPAKVYLDQPFNPKKNEFPCKYPGTCRGKQIVFGRPADLERHYKNVHSDMKTSFPCDYSKCPRRQEGFTRKDHYRDHLRDFHKEDIGCAKGNKSAKDNRKWQQAQKIWLAERSISPKHWRCSLCLGKCYVAQVGWECSYCKRPCEQDRILAREQLVPKEEDTKSMEPIIMGFGESSLAYDEYSSCASRSGVAWINDGYGHW